MDHVAIDLGGRASQICVRGPEGQVLEERQVATSAVAKYLQGRPKSRVIVETCAEAFKVADAAIAAGHEVRVVPATLVRALGVGARKTKTDSRDAQILSEVSTRIDLLSVHVPSTTARERRARCTARESLVAARTSLINSVRGWARTQGLRIRSGKTETFAGRMRDYPVPAFIEGQLTAIEALNTSLAEADKALAALAKADSDCRRLMTVPGVGPITAVRFSAALDDAKRFESAQKVGAYLGLTPGEDSSSERKRRTSITKAGPVPLRRTLVQAAWCAIRTRPRDPMVRWALQIAARRGKQIAAVALARKMAGILYALMRDGTMYERKQAAQVIPPT